MKNYQILVFIAWLLVFPMACQQTSNSKDGAHLKTIEKTSTTKQVNFIGHRITSYNVCYTKLLRQMGIVACD